MYTVKVIYYKDQNQTVMFNRSPCMINYLKKKEKHILLDTATIYILLTLLSLFDAASTYDLQTCRGHFTCFKGQT